MRMHLVAGGKHQFQANSAHLTPTPQTPLEQDLGGGRQAILSIRAVPYRQRAIASFSAMSRLLRRLQPLYFGEGPISEMKVVSLLLIRETRKAPIAIAKLI
jgi:hypothetical protein